MAAAEASAHTSATGILVTREERQPRRRRVATEARPV